jgi:hypothetical protein
VCWTYCNTENDIPESTEGLRCRSWAGPGESLATAGRRSATAAEPPLRLTDTVLGRTCRTRTGCYSCGQMFSRAKQHYDMCLTLAVVVGRPPVRLGRGSAGPGRDRPRRPLSGSRVARPNSPFSPSHFNYTAPHVTGQAEAPHIAARTSNKSRLSRYTCRPRSRLIQVSWALVRPTQPRALLSDPAPARMSRSARGSFSTMGSPTRPDLDLMVDGSPRVGAGSPGGAMSPPGGGGAYSPVGGSQSGQTPAPQSEDGSGKGKGKSKKERKDKDGNIKPSQRPSWR